MKLNLLFISTVLGQGQIFQEIGNGNVAKVKGKKVFSFDSIVKTILICSFPGKLLMK